ncbi:PhzF family phenazine biosynthesis protein [Brevibacterium casei]|uniref:PhzF family phenazine biosynthesis protein n=1 Tax=Brevibacterium casei TaxID=33889 RepID=UPI00223AD730|nr:PhzF family phenazine biosynthesis protein [Brevibacterium casei]MCT1447051.1 PhzF family phenazine biosynthesis protein [Brevibacterium casei]
MPRERAFAQVDVFSSVPYRGNPVAVILDAEGLSDDEMAQIANWTNLSETTFVLPPTDDRADYRLRIFTRTRELPFAGHPTLGSAAAWLHAGGRPRRADRLVQECGVGLVELRRGTGISAGTGAGAATDTDKDTGADQLAFAAPDLLRSGPLDESFVSDIAAALGIDRSEILDHAWVDNGPGWAAVRLASAEKVLALTPDFSAIPDTKLGVVGAYPHGSDHEYEVRAFVPGVGVAEDPVTGSLNASVAQWLMGSDLVPDAYTATQGTAIGRAGVISITRDGDTIWVGGPTTVCFTGTANA